MKKALIWSVVHIIKVNRTVHPWNDLSCTSVCTICLCVCNRNIEYYAFHLYYTWVRLLSKDDSGSGLVLGCARPRVEELNGSDTHQTHILRVELG